MSCFACSEKRNDLRISKARPSEPLTAEVAGFHLSFLLIRNSIYVPASIRANALWNIGGYCIPALIAILAIPQILANLGPEALGVLTLTWTVIGFYGLFDFGLGRSITHFAAQAHARQDSSHFTTVVWIGSIALSMFGILVAGFTALGYVSYIHDSWKLSDTLGRNLPSVVALIALGAPIALASVGMRAGLEATQRFRAVNLVRIPTSALTFAAPALISAVTSDIRYVVGSVVLARLLGVAGFFALLSPWLDKRASWNTALLLKLARYGGWASISGLASPLLIHLDRFVIATYVSLEAVAMYGSVFDVLARLLVIPAAITAALFPAISSQPSSHATTAEIIGAPRL